jgi:hypothetical protein
MQIYTIKDGKSFGPHTGEEILKQILAGELSDNDLGWCDGLAGAVPLSEIIFRPDTALEAIEIIMENIVKIAEKQKAIIWVAVAWVVFGFTPMWPAIAGVVTLAFYAAHVVGIVFCCQLAQALRKNVWLWGFLALVPLVNLFAYASMVSQAGKMLNSNGIRTGIFGASRREIDRHKFSNL